MDHYELTRRFFKDITTHPIYEGRFKINDKLKDENKDYFPYIPISPDRVALIIEDLKNSNFQFEDKSFMDIGCGIPIIPKIFEALGCRTSKGLEYQQEYVDADKENYLIQGDLLTYNFGNPDLLYSYNPIRDTKLMSQGLENIMDTMKSGAILYFIQARPVNPNTINKFTARPKNMYNILKFLK